MSYDLDTIGLGEPTNLPSRQDIRDEPEFQRNLSAGVEKQDRLAQEWVTRHQEIYADKRVQLVGIQKIVDDKINTGYHIDYFDGIAIVDWFDTIVEKRVELECVSYNVPWARFKKNKIERCIQKNCPIIHGQTGVSPSKLFVFSLENLKQMHAANRYRDNDPYHSKYPQKIYGGKLYHLFNTDNTPYLWVDFNTLSPVENYKELLKNLVGKK